MPSWWDWIAEQPNTQPWLILGKGPSFDRRHEHDLSPFATLGLNHVVREQSVKVAHVVDLEVIDECPAEAWLLRCEILAMPWHPHRAFRPACEPLDAIVRTHPILSRLQRERRLVWYNLSTACRTWHQVGSPIVGVRYFSAEAALNLLALAGIGTVRTLGIDGGRHYAGAFSDLQPLTGGQPTFDNQWPELRQIARREGMDLAPLSRDSRRA